MEVRQANHSNFGVMLFLNWAPGNNTSLVSLGAVTQPGNYCITRIFRVEEIFAIFANLDFARNFPPAKIISTANGISRNFLPAKFSSREIFLPAKIKL